MKIKESSIIRDTKGKLKSNLLSVLATLFVIGILLWSGPAQAVTLKLTFDTTTPPENTAITFTVAVDIAAGERVPVSNLTLTIGNFVPCTFNLDGTPIGGAGTLCENVTITQTANSQGYLATGYDYSTGMYGYGYGFNYSAGEYGYFNQTYPPGYGYGGATVDELEYTVSWTTPSVNSNTAYVVRLDANANDGTVMHRYTNTETITVQQVPLNLKSVSVLEADNFYSPYSGNNIIHLRVNVSGATNVTANFTNQQAIIDCGSGSPFITLTQQSADIWNGSCEVGTEAASKMFVGGSVVVLAYDGFGAPQMNMSQQYILYNLTTAPGFGCMRTGDLSTNYTTISNFGSVNMVLDSLVNLSCEMAQLGQLLPSWAPAWTSEYTRMALINFSNVDISTQEKAEKVMNVQSYLTLTMTPPNSFGDSRIFINTSHLAELNTTAVIKLFHLPFTSAPTIVEDVAGGVSGSVIWQQGTGIADSNLTFTVTHFSGYNISDNVDPNITISTPASAGTVDSPVAISVILNGTGSRIYSATFNAGGTLYYYNSTINSANCVNESIWSEKYTCTISQAMADGAQSINVTAVDFGGVAGRTRTVVRNFVVDGTAPTTTVNATLIPGGAAYTNNTWLADGYNLSVSFICSDGSGVGCSKTLYCTDSASGCTPSSVWAGGSAAFDTDNEGVTYLRYMSNDSLNNWEGAKEWVIKIDRTLPVVTITSPSSNGSSFTTNIDISFTTSDTNIDQCWWTADGGATNTSISCTAGSITGQSWGTGSHVVSIYANDTTNNIGFASREFTKSASSSSTSGGGSSSSTGTTWTATFVVDDLQQLIEGYEKELSVGQRLKIKLDNEYHYVGILSIVGNIVTIRIESTPIEVKLAVGDSKKVDIDGDGYYDIYVRLDSILTGKAGITVMKIHEKIPSAVVPPITGSVVEPVEEPEQQLCVPDWKCGAWSECVNGVRARVCTDANSCGTTEGKPTESESCTMAKAPVSGVAILVAILIVVVLCIVTMFYLQRRSSKGY